MPSRHARVAGANAVRAFLADVASHYLGRVYDHRADKWSKQAWDIVLRFFENRCAYCNTPVNCFRKGVILTQEHLVEINQWQVGLHHPGNTVPACSECNGARDKSADGSRLTWEQHLENIAKKRNYTKATTEARRAKIKEFLEGSGYPNLTDEEKTYLLDTAQQLYRDVVARCSMGTRGFLAIHKESAVRVTLPSKIAAVRSKQNKKDAAQNSPSRKTDKK